MRRPLLLLFAFMPAAALAADNRDRFEARTFADSDFKLPYRLLQCCTGDLGVKNASMIDVETWMPSRNGYGETHSASRLYDFQARRCR